MSSLLCFFLFGLVQWVVSMDNLSVMYEWKRLDFNFTSQETREEALATGSFIPENNIPYGIEVHEDRIFVTIPRFKRGVVASLSYFRLSDSKESPVLQPYPNWNAHSFEDETPQLVSPIRLQADSCNRLWILDTGAENMMASNPKEHGFRLVIFDLHNDELLRVFKIPQKQIKERSLFMNLVVEGLSCDNSFAYLADVGHPSMIVYSWKEDRSWLVLHNYFHPDPLAGEMSVLGLEYNSNDGLFGLALSGRQEDGFSSLYFHPLNSFKEFKVSTQVLQNESASASYYEYQVLGDRGIKSQSGVSFFHEKSNVLFYSLINLNAVACWKTSNPAYTMESQGRIFMSNVSMVYPNDIKIDSNDNLWVLSNKFPLFQMSKLNFAEVNFRILSSKVNDAIRGTACDATLVLQPTIVDKIMPVLSNITNYKSKSSNSSTIRSSSSRTLSLMTLISFLSILTIFLS